jgi:transcriptional antiterminator Rof (Rho-off)
MGQCLCLCDDDNDIEMALSCLHAYLPLISSESMEDCVKLHPANFTVISMSKNMEDGVEATEKALALVLERINSL